MISLLYSGSEPLVLASRSPRRRDLLTRQGVAFTVRPADVREEHPPGRTPAESARDIALAKARAVAATLARGLVLGADTVVVLDGEILGKPRDRDEARRMLARLGGRSHEVITGVALVDAASGRAATASERTLVTMRPLGEAEIARYVASGEPMDKAGAYGAQGLGAVFIRGVEGCFYNVVGLPLARLQALLCEFVDHAGGPAAAQGGESRA